MGYYVRSQESKDGKLGYITIIIDYLDPVGCLPGKRLLSRNTGGPGNNRTQPDRGQTLSFFFPIGHVPKKR